MKLFIQFVLVFLIMLFLFYVLLTGGKAVIDWLHTL